MATKSITIEQFKDTLSGILSGYSQEVFGYSEEAVRKVADEGVRMLKNQSRTKLQVRTGKYSGGWTKEIHTGRLDVRATLYNKDRPGLAHLLEHGHVTRNGTKRDLGRTPGHEHIKPVEDTLQAALLSQIEIKVRAGG